MADLAATIARIKDGMEAGGGMRLLGAYQTASGAPGRIIDLWELRDANAIVDALQQASGHPKHQATLDRLGESLSREQLALVEATSYCPRWRPPASPQARYLHATLAPRYGQVERVSAIVAELVDVLEARMGWRLVGAYRTVIGTFGEIVDLWEIPADRTVDDMLIEAREIPAFVRATSRLPELITSEALLTLRAASYCP